MASLHSLRRRLTDEVVAFHFFLLLALLGFTSTFSGDPRPAAAAAVLAGLAVGSRASLLAGASAVPAALAGVGGEAAGMAAAGALAGVIFYPIASMPDRYTLCYYFHGGRGGRVLEGLLAIPLAGIALSLTPGPQGWATPLGVVAASTLAAAVAAASRGPQWPVYIALATGLAPLTVLLLSPPLAATAAFTVSLVLAMVSLYAAKTGWRAVIGPAWLGYSSQALAAWSIAWGLAGAAWSPLSAASALLLAGSLALYDPGELTLSSEDVIRVAERACQRLGEGYGCVEALVCGG